MSWRAKWFGQEHFSRWAYLAWAAGLFSFALFIYGAWIDFLAATWLMRAALYVAVPAGMAGTGWLLWGLATGYVTPKTGEDGRHAFKRLLLVSPVLVALLAVFVWVVLARGIPGVITRLSGSVIALPPVVMHTDDHPLRWQCHYQLRGKTVHRPLQNHLCTSAAYYRAHPQHRVEVQVYGRRGLLGFYIAGFRHLHDLGPYLRK